MLLQKWCRSHTPPSLQYQTTHRNHDREGALAITVNLPEHCSPLLAPRFLSLLSQSGSRASNPQTRAHTYCAQPSTRHVILIRQHHQCDAGGGGGKRAQVRQQLPLAQHANRSPVKRVWHPELHWSALSSPATSTASKSEVGTNTPSQAMVGTPENVTAHHLVSGPVQVCLQIQLRCDWVALHCVGRRHITRQGIPQQRYQATL